MSTAAGAPVDSRWRLSRLLTAPHRLGFFSAALMLATSALWWALALATRHAGVALPWAVAPPLAHGLVMAMGFMPLFIVGFLFTAGPRWLGLSDVPARSLRDPVLTMLSGWVVALAGFHLHEVLAALGVALVAGGWSAIVLRFVRLLRTSPVADQLHARVIAAAAALYAIDHHIDRLAEDRRVADHHDALAVTDAHDESALDDVRHDGQTLRVGQHGLRNLIGGNGHDLGQHARGFFDRGLLLGLSPKRRCGYETCQQHKQSGEWTA